MSYRGTKQENNRKREKAIDSDRSLKSEVYQKKAIIIFMISASGDIA